MKRPERMLRQAPSAPIWPGTGAKVHTRNIVRDPASEMPTNLKLRSTDLRGGLNGFSDMAQRIHRFGCQRQALGAFRTSLWWRRGGMHLPPWSFKWESPRLAVLLRLPPEE